MVLKFGFQMDQSFNASAIHVLRTIAVTICLTIVLKVVDRGPQYFLLPTIKEWNKKVKSLNCL